MNTIGSSIPTLKQSRHRDYVILLEELEFAMPKEQLWKITNLNNDGYGVKEISKIVKRDPYEVILALLHQARTNRVKLKHVQL